MSIKKQATYNIIGRFIEFIIGMSVPIILVRIFNQTDYGIYQQILVIGTAIAGLLAFNFSHNLFYFFPNAKNFREKSILVSQTYFSLMLVGIAFGILFLLIQEWLISYIDVDKNLILFFPLFIFFTIMNRSFDNIFIIEGKAKLAMYYYSFNRSLRALFIIIFALFYKNVQSVLFGLIIYLLIVSIFLFIYLFYHYKITPFNFDKKLFNQQFKYSLPFGLSGIVGTIGNYADKIILTSFLPAKEFAIYSVGNFRLPFIELLYSSVGNVILPRISEFSKQANGKQKAYELWRKMIIKNMIITIPALVYFIFYADYLIAFLFGNQYYESADVFRILILMFLIQMLGFGYILRGFGITKPIFPANLLKMFVSILLGIPLIYFYGYIGASITFVLAFASNGIMQLIITQRFLEIKWIDFIPWKDLIILLLISSISLLFSTICMFFDLNNLFYLIFSSIVYFPVLFFSLNRLGYVSSIQQLSKFIKEI